MPQRYIFATTLQKLCLANDSFSIGIAHTRKAASELRRDELLPVLNVALNLTTKPVHCTYTHTKFTWHLQGTAVCVGLKKKHSPLAFCGEGDCHHDMGIHHLLSSIYSVPVSRTTPHSDAFRETAGHGDGLHGLQQNMRVPIHLS